MFELFFQAMLVGLSIAMPIGPIATLLIKNSLERGFKAGLAVGLGAAIVEGIYGFVAASGFLIVTKFLDQYLPILKLVCGFLLLILGAIEIVNAAKKSERNIKMKERGFFKIMFFVMLLTLANPTTIIFFAGVCATIGNSNFSATDIVLFAFGSFCGSILWTANLSYFIAKIHHKISAKTMQIIKIISGALISCFGIYGILNSF